MQRVKEFTIKAGCFSQEILLMGVVSLLSEPRKNRPCIDEWREYTLCQDT
jgi:hypothetical protein